MGFLGLENVPDKPKLLLCADLLKSVRLINPTDTQILIGVEEMVGFVSEPAIEEDDLSGAPKSKNSNDSPPLIDQKIIDISLADTFLDFESIKEWFEHFPDDSGSSQQPGELFMAEVKEVKTLCDGVRVKSELMSDGEAERASALRDVDDSKTVASMSLLKSDMLGDAENKGSCLDCQKSENVVNDEKGGEMGGDDSESEGSSESESTGSSSSSSSSSSDDDEGDASSSDDEDDGEDEHIMGINVAADAAGEMEEGEIRETDVKKISVRRDKDDDDGMGGGENADNMVSWSDVEDNDATGGGGGPVRSKNELKVLPHVPRVEAKLELKHQMSPVGVILSVLGAQVVVEGVEKHTPLNEGSILWITERRAPLGLVDEIFGPVKNPYYVVRYNSEDEVPSGISQGTLVSVVPEFASYILNEKNLYKKGYDASGENDEELSDEAEFSDDEKEAEYRRMQRMAKRGATDPSDLKGVNKNYGKKGREREGRWKNNSNSSNPFSQQMRPNVNPQIQSSSNYASSSRVLPSLMGGTGVISPFYPQPGSSVPVTTNEAWMNGNFPSQQQIDPVLANGFPNVLQWAAQGNQFPYQIPIQSPFLLPNLVLPNIGQSNTLGGLPFAPCSSPPVQNASNSPTFGMGSHEIPSFSAGVQGVQPNGLQMHPSAAALGSSEAPRMFNPGGSFGRGGKPPLNRRGGGWFTGKRGRRQFK